MLQSPGATRKPLPDRLEISMNATITLADLLTPAQFEQENSHLFEGEGTPSLEYLIRTRHINGLSECGAVIEPVQRRPMIVRPKFLGWLLNRKAA